MTGQFITQLRGKLLAFTQAELARALEVSPVTINRWENDDPRYKPSDKETRLLEALDELADTIPTDTARRDLHDLLRVSTVAGVIAKAAIERLLKPATVTRLVATPGLGWLGLVADIGVGAALPFFSKTRTQVPAMKLPIPEQPAPKPPEKPRAKTVRKNRGATVRPPAPEAPSLYSLNVETL